MKKTVLKVNINCQKCKTDVLKTATKLMGVDQVSVDAEKGILTVVGDVDPVLLTEKVRKSGKMADIMSIGPPKPPEKKPSVDKPLPPCCHDCQLVAIGFVDLYSPNPCSIL